MTNEVCLLYIYNLDIPFVKFYMRSIVQDILYMCNAIKCVLGKFQGQSSGERQ